MPIRTPVIVRSHAYTIRATEEPVDPWRIPDRLRRAPRNETPYPRRRTTDTPTCPAWRAHRRYAGSSIYDCVPFCVTAEAAGRPDRLATRHSRHSGKTAATIAVRRIPAFVPRGHPRPSSRHHLAPTPPP